jgi:hypothetical protein
VDYWSRVGAGWPTLIEAARARIPEPIWQRVADTRLFLGTDPVYAGLMPAEQEITDDGRSYRNGKAWCLYHGFGQRHLPADQRRDTIVAAAPEESRATYWDVISLIHEYGHALHAQLQWMHGAVSICKYAEGNWWESYACAFTYWCAPDSQEWIDTYTGWAAQDHATLEHFEALCRSN